LVFPGKLIPLEILGCWMSGSWGDLGGKTGWFGYGGDQVVFHLRDSNGNANGEIELGKLPTGWDCASICHHDSSQSGWFVGAAADIAEAKRLNDECDAREDKVGAMLYQEE
jgi:hypothetical protein